MRRSLAIFLIALLVLTACIIVVALRIRNARGRISTDDRQMETQKESTEKKQLEVEVGKVISKPQPAYPWLAQLFEISGDVQVKILIDEKGDVRSAEAISGPRLLRNAAVE